MPRSYVYVCVYAHVRRGIDEVDNREERSALLHVYYDFGLAIVSLRRQWSDVCEDDLSQRYLLYYVL